MAKQGTIARQNERDARQVKQHYVHWGVKAVTSLIAAAILGALWLTWVIMNGPR